MSDTEIHAKIKKISTLPINYAARIVGYAIEQFGITDPKVIADTFNMPLRTVYQGRADYFAASAASAESAADCTQCTQPAAKMQPAAQPAHIEERARLKETPTELSNSSSFVTRERADRLKAMFNGSTEGMIDLAVKAMGAGGDRASAEEWLANLADMKGAEHVQAAYGLWIENKVKNKGAQKISAWWAETADSLKRRAAAKDAKPATSKPTASAQRPAYHVPTRPIYDNREGISLEDALARKLITQEQYDAYSRQVAA